MTVSALGILFIFAMAGALVVFVYRYSRETSLFTDNLEFYLKQRTVSHNQDKAKLAIYKTKLEKLEREMSQLKNRQNDQTAKAVESNEQEKEKLLKLEKEVSELVEQNKTLLNEKEALNQQNQEFQRKLDEESIKFAGLLKANQGLQDRLDKLKGQIQLVESEKEAAIAKASDFAQNSKAKDIETPSAQQFYRSSLNSDEKGELQELRLRDQVAQRFEKLLKEKAQKDYNDILSLEKEIIHLRLKFEGQSHAIESIGQVDAYSQTLKPQSHEYNFAKQDLYQVQNEVTAIRSVVLNDIKPQMNQYMHELQGLAQRLRETRQSFFDNQLSRRAFESLSVEDVA